MARPTKFTQEIADDICTQLIEGKSLREICQPEEMVGLATLCRWLASDQHPEFREQYAHAREMQAELLADDLVAISDDASGDLLDGEFGETGNSTAVQRSKLRVDTRKWIASKLLPKKYGDKVGVEHSGRVVVRSVKDLTDEELAAMAGELAESGDGDEDKGDQR